MGLIESTSPDDESRVWSKYGLKQTPYLTTPTRLVGTLPLEKVFCGRQNEIIQLKKIICSSSNSATLIAGDFGVGKTTFVNFVRWKLSLKKGKASKYLTTNVEIKVQPDWDSAKYLLSTLSSIYTSSIVFNWVGDGMDLPSLKKIEECVSISTQRTYQGGVGAINAGYGETKSVPPIFSPEILEHLLYTFCSDMKKIGKEIIISYDNLEDIKDPDDLSDFFKSIRDYTQIEGLHSLFIGPPNIISSVEKYPQVHTVFSQPIILSSLSEQDVLEILRKRCEALKLEHGNYIQPYDEDTVSKLYISLNNQIRFTFKVLEDATLIMEKQAPCKITMSEIVIVQEKEKKGILSTLTNQQTRIVTALMNKEVVTQTQICKLTGITASNLSKEIDELERKGLITIQKDDKDKRFRYVKISEHSYLRMVFASEELKLNKTAF